MPGEKRALEDFCPRCGLKISKHSAPGSMTGYMFDPVRCKCATGDTFRPGSEAQSLADSASVFEAGEMEDGARTFAAGASAEAMNLKLAEGAIIGGLYSIIKPIGQGGMGIVYLALHQTLRKRCAVKLIPPEQVTGPSWKRFQLEAKTIARLDHKNVVKVTDLGLHKGYLPFYAMEYIEGETLAEKLEARGRLSLAETIGIFSQICEGVDYAHRAGIIHRDLKPGNVMIAGGDVKVLDFGLAKLTKQDRHEQSLTKVGDIFGSPYYMSPEQCRGEKVDNRSDIYSIGCTLFECLTGRPPFNQNNNARIMLSHQEDDPPSLSSLLGPGKMPDALEIVLAKLLRKNPVERYQTCRELASDLDKVSRGESVQPFYMTRSAKISGTTSGAKAVDEDEPEKSNPVFSPGLIIACGLALTLALGGGLAYFFNLSKPAVIPHSKVLADMQTADKAASKALASGAADSLLTDKMNTIIGHPIEDGDSPASAKESAFYSMEDSLNAKNRVFLFPTDTLIGSVKTGNEAYIPATGRVVLPQKHISFLATEKVIQFPQYLQRFRADEITKVRFENSEQTDLACRALRYLPNWQNLPSLVFRGFSKPFSPASQLLLGSLKGLRYFEFSSSKLDPAAIAALPVWPTIEDMTLSNLLEYQPILEVVSTSRKLFKITIMHGKVTDKELTTIAKTPMLRAVALEDVPMSAARLKILQSCPSLWCLSLDASLLDDPELSSVLGKFTKLDYVQFLHVPTDQVSKAKLLKQSLPGMDVKIDEVKTTVVDDILR